LHGKGTFAVDALESPPRLPAPAATLKSPAPT
jgi:hypothetical protein